MEIVAEAAVDTKAEAAKVETLASQEYLKEAERELIKI